MIKVLQVISDTNIGGAGRVLVNYLEDCDRENFEVHVVLPKGSKLLPMLEENAICHTISGLNDRSYHKDDVRLLRALIKELKPQVIHTHGAFSGRLAAKKCKIPVVFSRHSVFPVTGLKKYPPFTWLNGLLNCYFSDAIIAVSPAASENLVELGVPKKKITTIMNGVAPLEFASDEDISDLRTKLEITSEIPVFTILARLEPYKGHLLLLEACANLKKLGKKFILLIAGVGCEEEKLKNKVKELELEDCVKFLGFFQDVKTLLSLTSCQINASYGTEATSLSLLEGMSLGVPAIVSNYGGNSYVITHGENGLIFPQENAQELTNKMQELLENKDLSQQLSIGAKKVYSEKFTCKQFAENIENIYKRIGMEE